MLHRSAVSTTLRVPVSQIRRVRTSVNYVFLRLILLIGPFAPMPLLVGRRYLRLELPFLPSGSEPSIRLHVREVRGGRGDAETMATWLRMGAWAGKPSVPSPATAGANTLQTRASAAERGILETSAQVSAVGAVD